MSEYAPTAIKALYALVETRMPRATLSGILGDQAHTYGYHRCRNVLPSGDYSRTLANDKLGDGWAASALDISLPPDLMKLVTSRLLAAAKAHDPRLHALREFCGTTNGTVTHSYDLSGGYEGLGEWDDSHLWHVHLSLYRRYANDAPALAPIAQVIAGIPATEDDMSAADVKAINDHLDGKFKGKDGKPWPVENLILEVVKPLIAASEARIIAAIKATSA